MQGMELVCVCGPCMWSGQAKGEACTWWGCCEEGVRSKQYVRPTMTVLVSREGCSECAVEVGGCVYLFYL